MSLPPSIIVQTTGNNWPNKHIKGMPSEQSRESVAKQHRVAVISSSQSGIQSHGIKDKSLIFMLTSDLALKEEKKYRPLAHLYAWNMTALEADFFWIGDAVPKPRPFQFTLT